MTVTATPMNLGLYVGQTRMKQLIVKHLEATEATGRAFPHLLLLGPPGAGKTTLAGIVADMLGRPFVAMTRPPAAKTALVNVLSGLGDGGVLFIDEIHEWSRSNQDELLTLLEPPGFLDCGWGRMEFPNLTVIAATTEREKVRKPLMQRFPLRPAFEPYTNDEMAYLASFMAETQGLRIEWADAERLGAAAGGVPRQVRTLITHALALRNSGREVTVEDVLEMGEVEADGLTADHLSYLRRLKESSGSAGLDVLSTRMRLHPAEIRDLERLLLDRGLVTLTTTGRMLMAAGHQRLKEAA